MNYRRYKYPERVQMTHGYVMQCMEHAHFYRFCLLPFGLWGIMFGMCALRQYTFSMHRNAACNPDPEIQAMIVKRLRVQTRDYYVNS